ncbi:MAG: hypothetical protein WD969_02455 [Paracoccaceae bacterium]
MTAPRPRGLTKTGAARSARPLAAPRAFLLVEARHASDLAPSSGLGVSGCAVVAAGRRRVGAAPFGIDPIWRPPVFAETVRLSQYVFERGRDLREGGPMVELRARADRTLGGHAAAASAGAALDDGSATC